MVKYLKNFGTEKLSGQNKDDSFWKEYIVNETFLRLVDSLYGDFILQHTEGTAYLIEGIWGSGRSALLYALSGLLSASNNDFEKFCNMNRMDKCIIQHCNELRANDIPIYSSTREKDDLLKTINGIGTSRRQIVVCDDITELVHDDIAWLTSLVRSCRDKPISLIFTSFPLKKLGAYSVPNELLLIFTSSFTKVMQIINPLDMQE